MTNKKIWIGFGTLATILIVLSVFLLKDVFHRDTDMAFSESSHQTAEQSSDLSHSVPSTESSAAAVNSESKADSVSFESSAEENTNSQEESSPSNNESNANSQSGNTPEIRFPSNPPEDTHGTPPYANESEFEYLSDEWFQALIIRATVEGFNVSFPAGSRENDAFTDWLKRNPPDTHDWLDPYRIFFEDRKSPYREDIEYYPGTPEYDEVIAYIRTLEDTTVLEFPEKVSEPEKPAYDESGNILPSGQHFMPLVVNGKYKNGNLFTVNLKNGDSITFGLKTDYEDAIYLNPVYHQNDMNEALRGDAKIWVLIQGTDYLYTERRYLYLSVGQFGNTEFDEYDKENIHAPMQGCISRIGAVYPTEYGVPAYPAEYHTHHRYGIKWGCPLEDEWLLMEYYKDGYPVRLLFQTSDGETLAYINLTIKFDEKTQKYYLADAVEHDPVAEGLVTSNERNLVIKDAVMALREQMKTGVLLIGLDHPDLQLSDTEADSALLCRAYSRGNDTISVAAGSYGDYYMDQEDCPVYKNAFAEGFTYCVIIGNYRVYYLYGVSEEYIPYIQEQLPVNIELASVPGTDFIRFFIQNHNSDMDYMYYTEPQHSSGSQ